MAGKSLDDIEDLTKMMTKPTVIIAMPIDVPFAIASPDAFTTQKIATAVRVDESVSKDEYHSSLGPQATPTLLTVTEPTMATVNVSQAKTSNCCDILNGIAVVFAGVLLGVITYLPNMMMGMLIGGGESSAAMNAAGIGMAASACMAVGGIVGGIISACGHPCAGWLCILPGVNRVKEDECVRVSEAQNCPFENLSPKIENCPHV